MKLSLCAILFTGFISACSEQVDVSKLKVIEVQTLSAEEGRGRTVHVEILDLSRDMKFNVNVSCDNWDAGEKIKKRIGTIYKVYDLSSTVVPSYYRLSDRICPI